MKDKWKKLFVYLGIGKVESSADGIFMREEDIDKLNSVHEQNETLRAEAQAAKDTHAAALAAKDTEIASLQSQITTLTAQRDGLKTANQTLTDENAALKAGETKPAGRTADPDLRDDGKKKSNAKSKRSEIDAAILRGEEVADPGDEEEEETED